MLWREHAAEQTGKERAMSLSSSLRDHVTHAGSASDARLHGVSLLAARSLWGLVALIDLGVLLAGFPAYVAHLSTFCTDPTRLNCGYEQLAPAQAAALRNVGLSLSGYTIYALALDVLTSLLFLGVGALIFWHKSRERMGLFVSLLLITVGCLGSDGVHLNPMNQDSLLAVAGLLIFFLQWPALGFLFYTFPDGRFVPRWSWLLGSLFLIQFGFYILPYPYNYDQWPPLLSLLETVIVYGSAVGTLVYRYVAVALPAQRQQIKWLAFGFAWALLGLGTLDTLLPVLFPALNDPGSPYQLSLPISNAISYLSIPLGIGIALLRYRLWDIDTLINRALVYGTLTALLAALYAGLIIGLESLAGALTGVQATDQPAALVISTLAIAALFQPLRRWLQNLIDRRFYRRKYDAARTLAVFSAALRQEVDLNELCERLSAIVQETMQPAHVSLWLRPTGQSPAASSAQEESSLTPGAMP
jgi:hypothetical protein